METSAKGVTRMPLAVSVEWRSTTVTTDPPRSVQHLEWEVAFTLVAPQPIRAVALLVHGSETHWSLAPGDVARELELSARFHPWQWRTSEAVAVVFGGRKARVTDAALKQDARAVVGVTAPERAHTGEVTTLAELPGHGIALAFLAFAEDDTEERRLDRWRVRPAIAEQLPARFGPLASGYQTGTLT